MKRKMFSAIAAAVLIIKFLPCCQGYSAEKPAVSALAAVVISADTGEIIYSLNHNKKLPMASTTKIMTALLCLESGGLDEEFVVDSEAIKVEGSSMGLQEGDIVTKYALCCGMLLPSGNDAANAAAVRIAGSIEDFAVLMNERAEKMGLTQTFFVTPSGLEGEGHGSSAYDMALLAAEALKNVTFREICSSETIKLTYGNPPYDRWLKNTNKLLSMDDGVYGVKTGFTDEAGRCLVSACQRDGKNLICVTLNDRDDWNDHLAMYSWCFQQVQLFQPDIPESFETDIVGAEENKIILKPQNADLDITTASGELSDFSWKLMSAPFVYAPVKAGEQAAELQIAFKGREVRRIPLYAVKDYEYSDISSENKCKKSLTDRLFSRLREFFA